MPLFDLNQFSKKYKARVKCNNCNQIQEIMIPKGVTMDKFIKGEEAKCMFCGCTTLELKPYNYESNEVKDIKKDITKDKLELRKRPYTWI